MEGTNENVFERLGAVPVINGMGFYTKLGGAIISPTVWRAMTAANEQAVEMGPLIAAGGRRIAELIGTEAARVTPGAAAAIALGVAACMTGGDGAAMERLPDTTGLRSKVVLQRAHRYRYLRMTWMTGASVVEVGDEEGTNPEDLLAALDPESVAAVFFPGHLDGIGGTVPLARVCDLARERDVPVFVDAAFLNYPPESMRRFTDAGADLVCFSAKYYYGPNGGGFIAGRKSLIDLVAQLDFTGFESGPWRVFGRPFKLDKYTVVGTVLALEEWFAMDHAVRWAGYARAVQVMADAVNGLPGVATEPMCFTMGETVERGSVNCLVVRVDPVRAKRSAAEVHRLLGEGNPRIVLHLEGDDLIIAVDAMAAGSEKVVAERLRAALGR